MSDEEHIKLLQGHVARLQKECAELRSQRDYAENQNATLIIRIEKLQGLLRDSKQFISRSSQDFWQSNVDAAIGEKP